MNIDINLSLWPRQMQAFQSKGTEILFGGATEGGKSHFARVMLVVLCLAIPGLQCVLIRKKYDDILKNHVEGPTGFKLLLAPLIEVGQVKVTDSGVAFPRGSNIAFQHCQDERQFASAQGVEKHVLVIDEATQISERLIQFFRAWVRMPKEMKAALPPEYRDKLPLILYTANPIGPSAGYFRREFVKSRAAFAVEKVHGFLRQYIPSRAQDNPSVDMEAHQGRLSGLGDDALARALDEGDWDAPVGEFIRQWDASKHVVQDIGIPPAHLFKFMAFDWGGGSPFAVVWFFVSDAEEFVDSYGRTRWFPRGALVCYREWYGCDPDRPAVGIDMPNAEIARGIVSRTKEITSGIVITDSLPFQKRGGELMAETFARNGCQLTRGNTERVVGWKQMKDMLTGRDGMPMLYFAESCKFAADYIPALQRHKTNPEDAEDEGEATHICFAAGTMVRTPEGARPIEALTAGDRVIAGDGESRAITAAGLTRANAATIELTFDDGFKVCCTPEHKILTTNGWRRACDTMGLACIIGPCESSSYRTLFKSLTALDSHSAQRPITSGATRNAFTGQFGNTSTDLSPRVNTSTTLTEIGPITRSRISKYLTHAATPKSIGRPNAAQPGRDVFTPLGSLQRIGINHPRGANGIVGITRIALTSFMLELQRRVSHAVRHSLTSLTRSFVQADVSNAMREAVASTPLSGIAPTAASSLRPQSIPRQRIAGDHAQHGCVGKTAICVKITAAPNADVYCLTEPITHAFQLESGLVVSNCDAIRLACMTRPLIKSAPTPPLHKVVEPVRISASPNGILKQLSRQKKRNGRI